MKTFDPAGNLIDISGEIVVNDLNVAPVLNTIPMAGNNYVVMSIMTDSGHRRLVLVNPALIAQASQLQSLEHSLALTDNMVVTRTKMVELPVQTLTYSAAIAMGAGAMKFTKTGIAGVKTTDIIVARPQTPLAEGYMVGDAVCTTDGTIDYRLFRPALAIGANLSINMRTFALRLENS
ncbi:hypothetical protein [Xanthomonas phage Xp15]|uniref:Uncharacterized protein n=1 Tax=Xanthomonas phage Xp15 TaxID=322855 RepID=Q52PM6_9CAUD|nr:hypothetical protein XPXV15_gp05 [Xanthomonas phage Xp15]AAX84850.1 hypothetical protein [Xanthomonas phage Xp15]